MSSLGANAFDLAICDPPFGLDEGKKHATRGTAVKQKNGSTLHIKRAYSEVKDWDSKIPQEEYFNEIQRVSKKVLLFGGQHYTHLIPQSKGWIIWNKCNEGDFGDCEMIWSSWLKKTYLIDYMWAGMMQGKSLKEGRVQQGNKKLNEKRIHPNQKPVKVYKYLLQNFAQPGFKIFDSHLGSGSSRIAAYELGFDFVGCELDKQFFEAQESRWKKHTIQCNLFNTQN